jgi:hypothetical protein
LGGPCFAEIFQIDLGLGYLQPDCGARADRGEPEPLRRRIRQLFGNLLMNVS